MAAVQFMFRHPYVCLVNLLLLFLHLYILQPKRRHKSEKVSFKPSPKTRPRLPPPSAHKLKSGKLNVKIDKINVYNKATCERKPLDFLPNKRICYQTRLRSSNQRGAYSWELPCKVSPYVHHHGISRFTKLTGPETSEDEPSTLNEVTWTNEPSSLQFNAMNVSPDFGVSRPRWMVDKLSDVPEETERTTSQRQDSAGQEGDGVSLRIPSLQEADECLSVELKRELKKESPNRPKFRQESCHDGAETQGLETRNAEKLFPEGHPSPRHRSKNQNLNPLNCKTRRILTSKRQYGRGRLCTPRVESNFSSKQSPVFNRSRWQKGANEDIDGRLQGTESFNLTETEKKTSPSKHSDYMIARKHRCQHHDESNISDSMVKNHSTVQTRRNMFSIKQELNERGRSSQRRYPWRSKEGREAPNAKFAASFTYSDDWNSATGNQSRRANIGAATDAESASKKTQDTSQPSPKLLSPRNPGYEVQESVMESSSRPIRPMNRSRRFAAADGSSRRRSMAGVMGCKLTRGSDGKYECRPLTRPNRDLIPKQRGHEEKNNVTEARFPNQRCVSGTSLSCCSSGAERQLLGNRSDATLVGKRDSWIWFSHEHKPSLENFASRQRRFHSHHPRVAELAAEIRRQEEMNKDIEREAGSIVAMPCIMLGRVHLGPSATLNQLMKDAVISSSTQPLTYGTSYQTSSEDIAKRGKMSRKKQDQRPSHHNSQKLRPDKQLHGHPIRLSKSSGSSPAKTIIRDSKSQRPKSNPSFLLKEQKCSPKKSQASKNNKAESVPGVLLASPIKSSSSSPHSPSAFGKIKSRKAKSLEKVEFKGATSPSTSQCHPNLRPGQETENCASDNISANKLQGNTPSQANLSDLEMSCASTKASTSSLLNLGPRSHMVESCFDEEDQVSLMENCITQSHVYSVKSPPKTRQEGLPIGSLCESVTSLMSVSTRTDSSGKYKKEVSQPLHKIKTTPSPSAKSNAALSNVATGKINHDKASKDSKTKSPHTQSLTTSTIESSDSAPRGRLATLRQSVLNNEVTDSVNKILFETNDRSSSSYSPVETRVCKSQSEKRDNNTITCEATENTNFSKCDKSYTKKRHGKSYVNVFSPKYYLKKGSLLRQQRASPNSLNKSPQAYRSQSCEDEKFARRQDQNSKILRRSSSLLKHGAHLRPDVKIECGDADEPMMNEISNPDSVVPPKTELVDALVNIRRLVSYESNSDRQEGILDVEQPSLQDIESSSEEVFKSPGDGFLCDDKNVESVKNEEAFTIKHRCSPHESYQNNVYKSPKETFMVVDNICGNTNDHSRELNCSGREKNLEAHSANDDSVFLIHEPQCIETCALHQTHEMIGVESNVELFHEKYLEPKAYEHCSTKLQNCDQIGCESNEMVTQYVSPTLTVTNFKKHAKNQRTTLEVDKREKGRQPSGLPSPAYSTKPVCSKDNVKTVTKTTSGKRSGHNLAKRHIPVSALIADLPDICNRKQSTTPSPGSAAGVSSLGSQMSLAEKISKPSRSRQSVCSKESINQSERLNMSSPAKHTVQNVSHLRRVHKFYGKRQMRITRSVGVVQNMEHVNKSNPIINDNVIDFDSKSDKVKESANFMLNIDANKILDGDHLLNADKSKEVIVPHQTDKNVTLLTKSRSAEIQCSEFHKEAQKSNTCIYKSFKKTTLLSKNLRSSYPFGLRSPKAQLKGNKDPCFHTSEHLNVDLLENAPQRHSDKHAESGSTNNSSSNLPNQQDVHCAFQTPLSMSAQSKDLFQSLFVHSKATKGSLSKQVKQNSDGLAFSQNVVNLQNTGSHLKIRFKTIRDGKSAGMAKPLNALNKGKIDQINCKRPPIYQTVPATKFSKRHIICRQNVSSSLRKEHAMINGKDANQANSKDLPTAFVPFYKISKTKSIVPKAQFIEANKKACFLDETSIRKETPNVTEKHDSTNTEASKLPRPTLEANTRLNCIAKTNPESASSNQANVNVDSGFDETISMSERTRAQTYSITDKLGSSPKVEYQPVSEARLATDEEELFDDCTRAFKPKVHVDEAISRILTFSDFKGDIALKGPSSCVEQETSSIDTEGVFSSRATSFWDELESAEEQMEIDRDFVEIHHNDADAIKDPTGNKKQSDENVEVSAVHTLHDVEFQAKVEHKNESANEENTDYPFFIDGCGTVHSGKCGVRMLTSTIANTQKSATLCCRKVSSAFDLFANKKPNRFQKSNHSSPSLSPGCLPTCTVSVDFKTKYNDLKSKSFCKFVQSKQHKALKGEGKNKLNRKTNSITPDQTSPTLDCLCVWTSSPCHCQNESHMTPCSGSIGSTESPERATEISGSKLSLTGDSKKMLTDCKEQSSIVRIEDTNQNEINTNNSLGLIHCEHRLASRNFELKDSVSQDKLEKEIHCREEDIRMNKNFETLPIEKEASKPTEPEDMILYEQFKTGKRGGKEFGILTLENVELHGKAQTEVTRDEDFKSAKREIVESNEILETSKKRNEELKLDKENNIELYEKVKANEKQDKVFSFVEEAVQVALPPTSSDDDDDNDECDDKKTLKLQTNTDNIKQKPVHNIAFYQTGETLCNRLSEPSKNFGYGKTELNASISPPNLDQTHDKRELSIENKNFNGSGNIKTEEIQTGSLPHHDKKAETNISTVKPRAKKRRLPGVQPFTDDKPSKPNRSQIEAIRPADLSQSSHNSRCFPLSDGSEKALSVTTKPKTFAEANSISSLSSSQKVVKIERRSVAFQDLLKRF